MSKNKQQPQSQNKSTTDCQNAAMQQNKTATDCYNKKDTPQAN